MLGIVGFFWDVVCSQWFCGVWCSFCFCWLEPMRGIFGKWVKGKGLVCKNQTGKPIFGVIFLNFCFALSPYFSELSWGVKAFISVFFGVCPPFFFAFISVFFGVGLRLARPLSPYFSEPTPDTRGLYLRIFRRSSPTKRPLSPYFSESENETQGLYLRIFRRIYI